MKLHTLLRHMQSCHMAHAFYEAMYRGRVFTASSEVVHGAHVVINAVLQHGEDNMTWHTFLPLVYGRILTVNLIMLTDFVGTVQKNILHIGLNCALSYCRYVAFVWNSVIKSR